ncbi:sigma-54 dependent transcriptional regulator [Mucilaginibacter psychrotolerans]|nr:sigma 54-interacting transcriptional regulator [Mucilaginibacter psychrotolerans]
MKENILIVEDEFIVANDLRLKLAKAGYQICGIAPSVEEAKKIIEKSLPTWVLLDIFLQDGSMGTDLAPILTEKNIGFIYISANTNQSVLESAKATQPYGFLVKPFREKDLLIMLDIARQKHQSNLDLFAQRELIWKKQLEVIIISETEANNKIIQLPGFFQSFIPFDFMRICFRAKGNSKSKSHNFIRTGFDEYELLDDRELHSRISFSTSESGIRIRDAQHDSNFYLNEINFKRSLMDDIWEKRLSSSYNLNSKLNFHVPIEKSGPVEISFYSKRPDGYSKTQLSLLERTKSSFAQLFEKTLISPPVVPAVRQSQTAGIVSGQIMSGHTGIKKFDGIIGKSPALLEVLDKIEIVAPSGTLVLITGESGTGKERVAQCIHKLSPRKNKPLIIVNCAALPLDLVESELFGHEKGAFTGAFEKRIGKFEQADGSTIFLDEIGELPLSAQVKLLRVLQEMEFERVGSSKTTKINVRVLAATNRNLEKEVSEGRFRLDLYYRLNVFPIEVPPLRKRLQDIPLLAEYFMQKFTERMGRQKHNISKDALDSLQSYDWPGNIREMEHLIERSILDNSGTEITSIRLPAVRLNSLPIDPPALKISKLKTLDENEAEHIIHVLKAVQGRVAGAGGAAEILGLPAGTLYSRMKKLGIKKEFDTDN